MKVVERSGKRVLVTGGAGFVGSRLVEELLLRGDQVVVADSMVRASMNTVRQLEAIADDGMLSFMLHDVRSEDPLLAAPVDEVYHLACFVGPTFCAANPLTTIDVAYEGTRKMLELAKRSQAKFLFVSSSEIYGRALMHPTPEAYGGNLDPNGARGPYAEGKRIGETLTTVYRQEHGLETRIVRLFNVYGPRMQPHDGRIVPTFLRQAFAGEPLSVHADDHTRSYAYVDDIVRGLVTCMAAADDGLPVNLGHAQEWAASDVAAAVIEATGSSSPIEFVQPHAAYHGEPEHRAPDLTRARMIGWEPVWSLYEGLAAIVAREAVAA